MCLVMGVDWQELQIESRSARQICAARKAAEKKRKAKMARTKLGVN